jgi:hypothetical protein
MTSQLIDSPGTSLLVQTETCTHGSRLICHIREYVISRLGGKKSERTRRANVPPSLSYTSIPLLSTLLYTLRIQPKMSTTEQTYIMIKCVSSQVIAELPLRKCTS